MTTAAPPTGTQAIERAAQLLVMIAESTRPSAVGDLATRASLPKSTASRLLGALERHGLVQQDGDRGGFRPGPVLLRVAHRGLGDGELAEMAAPVLSRLADASGETVNLAVPTPLRVEVLAQVETRHFLGSTSWVGRSFPLHASALGRVFMAHGVVPTPAGRLEQLTPSTISDPDALAAELATVRRSGFAITIDELEPGLCAIAAPVRVAGGDVRAAISISGPTLRLSRERLEQLGPLLAAHADALSERLGHRHPTQGAA